jgi:DNA invertase Pin-like site-specific DNA recombinase
MAMGIGRRGHGPSEVTCRIGGDRPGCDFMITTLGERRANTGTSTWRLILVVLGGLADVERDLIRTHTAEGRSRAKAQGKHIRRPPSLTPAQQKEAIRRRARGATLQELARSYNASRATISRLAI